MSDSLIPREAIDEAVRLGAPMILDEFDYQMGFSSEPTVRVALERVEAEKGERDGESA